MQILQRHCCQWQLPILSKKPTLPYHFGNYSPFRSQWPSIGLPQQILGAELTVWQSSKPQSFGDEVETELITQMNRLEGSNF